MDENLDVETTSQELITSNLITSNLITSNLITSNLITSNLITSNQLAPGQFSLNPQATSGLESTADGRLLLQYIIRCAFEPGVSLVFTEDGVDYHFPGLFGLAPTWRERAIDQGEKERMSACLLSHVNLFGVPVPFSARMYGYTIETPDELADLTHFEGAFFGVLFDTSTPVYYACSSDDTPDFTVSYPNHDTTEGDRLLRRCTDEDANNPGTTMCGYTYVGACSDHCTLLPDGSYSDCYTGANQTGTLYPDVMNSWLYEHDDPNSVWPHLYHEAYGS